MEDRKFTSREAAELAGINPATFRSYFKKGQFQVIGSMDRKEAAKDGLAHIYGWNEVLGFAVAQAMIECGASPAMAFQVGVLRFAHSGTEDRYPGKLFDQNKFGMTFLAFCHATGGSRIFAEKSGESIMGLACDPRNAYEGRTQLILLNYVDRGVHMRLREMRGEE